MIVHNWYGSSAPSGENVAVKAEVDLLRSRGINVLEYYQNSDRLRKLGILGKIIGGMLTPFNPYTYFQARILMRNNRPDVIHLHNFFPIISPSIFYAASHEKIPIIFTLHNYRIGCGGGLPFRNESVCLKCLSDKSVYPLLLYRCYRNSLFASFPLAVMISLHRVLNTWKEKITLFITLTDFQARILSSTDLIDYTMVRVKPQFMSNPPKVISFFQRENRVIFAGRISKEKGLSVLLEAWKIWGSNAPTLLIIGDGPDREYLEKTYKQSNIIWMGKLSSEDVVIEIGKSKMFVLPSICFEGFPMVIREALATGVPVIASNIGPLSEIVKDSFGDLFPVCDSITLNRKLKEYFSGNQDILNKKSINARLEFDQNYSADHNFKTIFSIYNQAIALYKNSRKEV